MPRHVMNVILCAPISSSRSLIQALAEGLARTAAVLTSTNTASNVIVDDGGGPLSLCLPSCSCLCLPFCSSFSVSLSISVPVSVSLPVSVFVSVCLSLSLSISVHCKCSKASHVFSFSNVELTLAVLFIGQLKRHLPM